MRKRKRDEIELLCEELSKARVYCPNCGHSVVIVNKSNMALCSWCKIMVFKDKQTEFKYRMKENLIKEKRKENGRKKEKL